MAALSKIVATVLFAVVLYSNKYSSPPHWLCFVPKHLQYLIAPIDSAFLSLVLKHKAYRLLNLYQKSRQSTHTKSKCILAALSVVQGIMTRTSDDNLHKQSLHHDVLFMILSPCEAWLPVQWLWHVSVRL